MKCQFVIRMCIMEYLEISEYSGIFLSNPENRILFRNNCGLVKRYASVYAALGTAGADISALRHDFYDNPRTTEATSTFRTLEDNYFMSYF